MGALITVLTGESGAREEKQSPKEEAFNKAGVRMTYTIGYNQDSERRTVPGSHWNHWGPTASSIELERMMLSSRSVLSLSPFPPSQSGPGSTSSHGYLSPPLLLVWPRLQIPYFLGVHLFLGRSYAYGRGFNRAQEAQDCCATPASPLSSTVASVIVSQTFLRGIPLHLKPQKGQLHIWIHQASCKTASCIIMLFLPWLLMSYLRNCHHPLGHKILMLLINFLKLFL